MTKLTEDQIESTITQSHANILAVAEVTREQRVVDMAITRELRACFTAGKDHGEACVIERAEYLIPAVANAQHEALGRAVMTLCMWRMTVAGRNWDTAATSPTVWVFMGEGETFNSSGCKSFTGSELFESFAMAAAWCEEHRFPMTARDTIPASPPAIGGSHSSGPDHDAPSTERNL
jgi:hypothetical protein